MKSYCSSSHLIAPVTLPSRREAHIWYILPDEVETDGSLFSRYLNVLSPCEKQNVLRMQGDKLQKNALLARTLVRTTLARYTNSVVSPCSLKFIKNTFGKPEVEWQYLKDWDPPSLHFNLSHTSSLIACGVTIDMPIGIDVEEKERKTKNNPSSLARRYFSLDEVEYLRAILDPDIQRKEFIKLWTLKEAYVKALGRGFSASPFKTFTIRFNGTSRFNLHTPKNFDAEYQVPKIVVETCNDPTHLTSDWKFALLELENSHYASICMKNKMMEDDDNDDLKLKVWKTIPFIKEELIFRMDTVRIITGLH